VGQAIDWLGNAFGFTLRLRIFNHRAQLNVGDGTVIVTEQHEDDSPGSQKHRVGGLAHSVMVRIPDVDGHCERAKQHGARILSPPADYPYGERQYTAEDLAGHCWTFSQSIADIDPEAWGGTPGQI
jgi:uncharacterized glyoxalase superfamily protein PhnB